MSLSRPRSLVDAEALGHLTPPLTPTNNASVIRSRPRRKCITGLAVLSLLALALLPQTHIHEGTAKDDRHVDVIHQHFEPHDAAESQPEIGNHHRHEARWLSSPFTSPDSSSQGLPLSLDLVLVLAFACEPQMCHRWTLPSIDTSVHDPPWAASLGLRAPPSFFV
jgi:hypothetical protein